jgi:hypothetical protein
VVVVVLDELVVVDGFVVVVVGADEVVVVLPGTDVVVVLVLVVVVDVVVVVVGAVDVVVVDGFVVVVVGADEVVVVLPGADVVVVLVLVVVVDVVGAVDVVVVDGFVVVVLGLVVVVVLTVVVVSHVSLTGRHCGCELVVGPPAPTTVAEIPSVCGFECGIGHCTATAPITSNVVPVVITGTNVVTVASAFGAVNEIDTSGVVNTPGIVFGVDNCTDANEFACPSTVLAPGFGLNTLPFVVPDDPGALAPIWNLFVAVTVIVASVKLYAGFEFPDTVT